MSEQIKQCKTCRYSLLAPSHEPCASCAGDEDYGHWEPAPADDGKPDRGKDRWELVPWEALRLTVRVLTFGARDGLDPWRWQTLPNGRARFFAALHRHLDAWWQGEANDPDSGLPHLAHVVSNALFLLALEIRK